MQLLQYRTADLRLSFRHIHFSHDMAHMTVYIMSKIVIMQNKNYWVKKKIKKVHIYTFSRIPEIQAYSRIVDMDLKD